MRTGRKHADDGQVNVLEEFAKPARWKRVPGWAWIPLPTAGVVMVFSGLSDQVSGLTAGGAVVVVFSIMIGAVRTSEYDRNRAAAQVSLPASPMIGAPQATVAASRVFSRARSRTVYHYAGGFVGRSTTPWLSEGGLGWERGSLVVDDEQGQRRTWAVQSGGSMMSRPILYQAPGSRPRSHAAQVVEIAAVGDHGFIRRLLLLNQDLCRLASIPVLGFGEDAMVDVARAAGIEYRRYHIDAALSGDPLEIGGYFPRASQFVSIAGSHQAVSVARWVVS
jgi:hypothetical protein